MPRAEEVNREIRERRRAEILRTAAPVFARKGFASTRISDLAEAAGMSQGLLYRYFASKDEIFLTIVTATVQHSIDLAQQALSRPGPPWERLRWFVATFLPLEYERPEYALIVSHALTSEAVPAEIRERALEHLSRFKDLIRELIVAGQAAGEVIQRDPEQLAVHLLATLHGLGAGSAFYRRQALGFPDPEILLLSFRTAKALT